MTTVFKRIDHERGTHIFDNVNCCGPNDPSAQPCNAESGADQALNTPNHHFNNNSDRLTFDGVKEQINAGRPICAEISWAGGGAHFAVIYGYTFDLQGHPLLEVGDPAYGNWRGPYGNFLSNYRGSGTWVATTLSQP